MSRAVFALFLLHCIAIQVIYGNVEVIKPEVIYKLYDSNLTSKTSSWVWTTVAVIFVIILFGTIFFFNRFMQHELTEYAVLQPVANTNEAKTSKRETKKEEAAKEPAKEANPSSHAPDSTMTAPALPKVPVVNP